MDMTRYSIVYTVAAKDDLDGIGDYVAHNVNGTNLLARMLVAEIREEIRELQVVDFGHRYDCDPWYERHVETFTVRKYRVFYWKDENAQVIYVLRVIHGARNVDVIMTESVFPFVH